MRMTFPAVAGTLAVAGGIFLGLFSCGGYVWHQQLFAALFATSLLGSLLLPPDALKRWPRRAVVVATLAAFVVIRAVASAFYPGTPRSIGVFVRAVLAGFWNPGC